MLSLLENRNRGNILGQTARRDKTKTFQFQTSIVRFQPSSIMATTKKGPESSKQKGPSQEEIFKKFQTLRNEQRDIVLKITEIEAELGEHKMVIDTLKDLDGDRKCFRMIGGVLCERTVKEVLPALENKRDMLSSIAQTFDEKLTKKGTEINEFKELHNIRLRGQEQPPSVADGDSKDKEPSTTRKNVMVEAM